MGKVAIIRDIAAVTYAYLRGTALYAQLTCTSFEAMIYFLYTDKITFAPLSSDQCDNLPAEERAGDWNAAKLPSPSAKSIYRLADKVTGLTHALQPLTYQFQYDIPTLKERAKEHIHANLSHCNIVDEAFSSFSSL